MSKESNRFYVYVYIDPRASAPFYIGKGTRYRYREHLHETKEKTTNILKWRKINAIRNDGLEPIIEFIVKDIGENEAYRIEEELIKKYGRLIDKSGILTNITTGEGSRGLPEETRKIIGEKTRQRCLGTTASEETKKKMSKSHTGLTLNLSTDERNRRSRVMIENNIGSRFQKGHTPTPETRIKMSIAKKGKTSPRKGVKLSIKTKKRISKNNGMARIYRLVSPINIEYIVKSKDIQGFCKANNLDYFYLQKCKKLNKLCKGWSIVEI